MTMNPTPNKVPFTSEDFQKILDEVFNEPIGPVAREEPLIEKLRQAADRRSAGDTTPQT